jgi:hypothetical protein
MSTYRTGGHRGVVTIVREGESGATYGEPGGDPEPAQPVAVVVNGDQELAELICALLNEAPDPCPHGWPGGERCGPCSFDHITGWREGPCAACGRTVRQWRDRHGGGGAIVDVEPSDDGDVWINPEGTPVGVVNADVRGRFVLYRSHFFTCPNRLSTGAR